MRKPTHMIKRDGVYYFRRRVVEDLISHYSPKTKFKFSLKTREPSEADRLERIHSVRRDAEFQTKGRLQRPPAKTVQ
jgi:hypothetical protein